MKPLRFTRRIESKDCFVFERYIFRHLAVDFNFYFQSGVCVKKHAHRAGSVTLVGKKWRHFLSKSFWSSATLSCLIVRGGGSLCNFREKITSIAFYKDPPPFYEIFLKKCQNLHFPRAFQQSHPNVYIDPRCGFSHAVPNPCAYTPATIIKRKIA